MTWHATPLMTAADMAILAAAAAAAVLAHRTPRRGGHAATLAGFALAALFAVLDLATRWLPADALAALAPLHRTHGWILLAAAGGALAAGHLLAMRGRAGAANADDEASFRALIEGSDIPMQILRMNGERIFVNRAGAAMFGFDTVEELNAVPAFGLVAPEDRDAARRAHAEFLAGRTSRFRMECRTLRRDGTPIMTDVHIQRMRWGGADALLMIHLDITERVRAEEAVRRSEARLNEAQRIANFGSWEQRLDTGQLEISDEGLRMLGLSRTDRTPGADEVLSRFHPDDIPAVRSARAAALRDGAPYSIDYRIAAVGGGTRHVRERGEASRDADGRARRLSGVVQDITELRRAQDTLLEQESFYRELIEILPDAIYVHVDRAIVMANSATATMFGASAPGDMLGLDPDTLIHPDDLEVVRRRRRKYEASGTPSPYARVRYLRLDGSSFVSEACAANVMWNGKRARLIVNRDIASRVEAETALRESEERLKQAQRIARMGDWMHDLDTGATLWSDEMYRIFGLRRSDGPRERAQFLDMVHPEDRDGLLASMRNTAETGRFATSEYRIVRPDGAVRHVRTAREFMPGADGARGRLRGITQDITEQKEIEAELRASEERFRDLIEGSVHGVVIRAMDGRREYMNQAFLDMFGFESLEEAHKAPRGALAAPPDRDRVLGYAAARLSGRDAPDNYQVECQRTDGTTFPAHFHVRPFVWKGAPTFYYSIFDLTELKRAEQALRDSEKNFRDVVENSFLGVMIRRKAGERLYVNQALVDMLGYDGAEQILALDQDAVFIAPQDRERVRDFVRLRRAGDSRPTDYEVDCLRTDGSTFPAHFYVRELTWRGEPAVYTTIVDLTNLKRAEQEVQQLNQELEARVEQRTRELRQAQVELVKRERLATLGQLTATVSHELRNPLGAMRNSFYVVRNRLQGGDGQLVATLDRIDRNITRCDRIIDELLDYTRIRDLSPVAVPLDDWLAEVLDEHEAPAGIAVRRTFGLSGAIVSFDPDRMRRAVINALDNAFQALADDARPADGEPPAVAIATGAADGRIEITIADNGPGIPEDIRQLVLEPLFSTRNFGVGLGLPVVQQIMQQHGGNVRIETVEGRGVSLTLWFPARLAPAAARVSGS